MQCTNGNPLISHQREEQLAGKLPRMLSIWSCWDNHNSMPVNTNCLHEHATHFNCCLGTWLLHHPMIIQPNLPTLSHSKWVSFNCLVRNQESEWENCPLFTSYIYFSIKEYFSTMPHSQNLTQLLHLRTEVGRSGYYINLLIQLSHDPP